MAAMLSPPLERSVSAVFESLREELDPERTYSPTHLGASLKSLGLTPADIDPKLVGREIALHPKVPNPKQAPIKQQRAEIWDGLRHSRLRAVAGALESLTTDDVRRFNMAGDGVRAVRADDIPPAHALGGMGSFEEMMAQKHAKNREEQQRKASALVTGFLTEKKRMDEADAKILSAEQRLQDYKKEQEAHLKERRLGLEKKAERRKAGAERAKKERDDWELEQEAKMEEKMVAAKKRRAEIYSKENLAGKIAAAEAKRYYALNKACEEEEIMLAHLEEKHASLQQRLEERDSRIAEEQQLRRDQSEQKFRGRQVRVQAQLQQWAEKKLSGHEEFTKKFQERRGAGEDVLKQRSKSCGEISRKARDKWRNNYTRLGQERDSANTDLLERHEANRIRCEERAEMKFKCDTDVYSFREIKDGTWGELTRKRIKEYQRARDAHTQALVFKIAEDDERTRQKEAAQRDYERSKQRITAELLKQKTKAQQAFIKMQCEADERKILDVMSSLGFDMPRLPDLDDEEEGGEKSKAAL